MGAPQTKLDSQSEPSRGVIYTPQFLDGRAEALFLYFPIVITAALFLYAKIIAPSVLTGNAVFNFVAAILLFDTSHTIFSWGMLSLPEMKQWRREVQSSSRFFYGRWAAVAISIFAFFVVGSLGFEFSSAVTTSFTVFIIGVLPAHHTIFQMKGLSLNYDIIWMKHAQVPFDAKKLARIRRMEHAAIWIVLLSTVLMAVRARVDFFNSLSPFVPWVSAFGYISAAGLLVAGVSQLPRGLRGKKALFLVRVLSLPLACFFMWGLVASRAIHGIEYLFVTRKMIMSSSGTESEKVRTIRITVALFVFVTFASALLFLIRLPDFFYGHQFGLLVILSLILATNTYTHYWFDSVMWSMKNPINRKWVAPLLAKNSFVTVKKD